MEHMDYMFQCPQGDDDVVKGILIGGGLAFVTAALLINNSRNVI